MTSTRRIILFSLVLFISCIQKQEKKAQKQNKASDSTKLIEVEELLNNTPRKNIKIIDFRTNEEYRKGHIPGALNIWRNDIEDKTMDYKGMMAQKEVIETLFSNKGISNDDQLIIYDDKGSPDASRLWWMLKYYGFHNVKLLNGGLSSWKKINGEISQETREINPTKFRLPKTLNNELVINKEEVLQLIKLESDHVKLIDARTLNEFNGSTLKQGAFKSGRIPKSKHIDWAVAIDFGKTNTFKSPSMLKEIYRDYDIKENDTIIVYCHSGVRSAHTTFVLTELLGYKNVKNYDGSWIEWSYYNLPVINENSTILN